MKADVGKAFAWKQREYESELAVFRFVVVALHAELDRRRTELVDEKRDHLMHGPRALVDAGLGEKRGGQGHQN